tara:strand:- start:9727 stop:9954 length:228 start_codon:yes stop_codon:yes gene_type:complete
MEIEYNNKKIKISSFESESDYIKSKKLEFIKKMETKKIHPNLVNKYSKIWVNIKYKKCFYDKSIFNFIKSIDSNI